MENEQKKSFLPISIIIAGILIGGAFWITRDDVQSPPAQDASVQQIVQTNPEKEGRALLRLDNILGNPNADVLIVEFSDIECPFCKELHKTLHEIIKEEGIDGRVSWAFRHFPITKIHPKAIQEAYAAECAAELGGNESFWAYTDELFLRTPSNNEINLEILPKVAEFVGLDVEQFNACMKNPMIHEKIDQDLKDGIAAGVTGTPYVFIFNGNQFITSLPGAQPKKVLKSAIELAL